MTMRKNDVRSVQPETIDPGDRITAIYRDINGIIVTHTGTVHMIQHEDIGGGRTFRVENGGVISRYKQEDKASITFHMIQRAPYPEGPGLF